MSAAEILRSFVVLAAMFSTVGWALSINLHWDIWADDLRNKLVSLAILPILATNGYGVAYAATKGYPISPVTISLAVWFVVLNFAMYVPLPKPNHPQRRKSDRLH